MNTVASGLEAVAELKVIKSEAMLALADLLI
jgi:hypothetical protein